MVTTHAIHKHCTKSSHRLGLSSIQGFREYYMSGIFREGRPSVVESVRREIDRRGRRRTHASFSVLGLLVTNGGTTTGRSPLAPNNLHILLGGGLMDIGFLR
jgi:hypothetical protein